jgi:hypothetical protein
VQNQVTQPTHFLSLRWKLLLILFSVSAILSIASSYYFQHQLLLQFEQTRKEAQIKHAKQINGLISMDVERIRQLAATLPTFINMNNGLMKYDSPAFYHYFESFWSSFQIDMGVENAKLYAPDGHVIATWGNEPKTNRSVQSKSWEKNWETVLNKEVSNGLIACADTCNIYAFAPILQKGEMAGAFSIGASLADTVLSFKKTSNADLAIIFSSDSSSIKQPLWGMHVAAASSPELLIPLITKVASVYSFAELSKKPVRYVDADDVYEISLVKLETSHSADEMQLIVIENIADDLATVEKNSKQVMIFAMVATVLILALL